MIIIKFQILSFFIYLLFLLLFLPNNVHASIHYYSKQPFTHRSNAFFFHAGAEALFSSSFIRFESISFTRPKHSAIIHGQMQQNTGLIESIILEVKDRNRIGGFYFNPKSDLICCDPFLSKTQNCNLGEVIIHNNPQNPNFPKRLKTFFQGTNQIAHMDPQTVQINATGIYYLYFMFCDPNLEGTTFTGRTVWRNPNGYLPGKMQPFITLYAFMSLAYLLLGLAWFLRFLHFWKEKDVVHVHLHYHITAVIALGMVEMAFWYFEYANFNATGSRPMGITIWAVTFTSVKKTLSRLLLLVVSMGYGVVRPTLFEGFVSRVTVLGGFYFVAYGFQPLLGIGRTGLLIKTRRNLAKLEIYRKFTNTLAVSVLLSIAWIGFELYFNATDPLSELWQIAWIIPTFWCLLSYTLLLVICVLWAPSRNPTRMSIHC
ncbi:lung seven transmembrane receptor family protein [Medicago truncatula]|uniref:Lung seven transmembrane receptor family protein n=1 Tax=Medicago truncatula TaxID=3880 RepID=A0A072TKQ4_MEDTR|nr:lung seven transmembrane receptor family protein [Medicago truncatula]